MHSSRAGQLVAILATLAGLGACSSESSAPPPDPSVIASTMTASDYSLTADGVSTATITVTLKAASGVALTRSGGIVAMRASTGLLGGVHDNEDGTYTATATAPLGVGVDTISATLDGVPLTDTVRIQLVAGPPARVSWDDHLTWLYADGVSLTDLRALVLDASGNRVTALGAVVLRTTAGILTEASSADGYWQARLRSSTRDETAVVTVSAGGSQVGPSTSIRFDAQRHWTARAPMLDQRMNMGVVAVDGLLYSVGGTRFYTTEWLDNLDSYDPLTDSWTARSPMPTPRADLGVATVDGILYAIGGSSGGALATVEAFDPSSNTWSARAPMPTARSGLGVAVVNGILYAMGGRVGGSGYASIRAPLAAPRQPAGGHGIAMDIVPSTGAISVMEAYNPATNTWTTLSPMPVTLTHFGVGVIGGLIYVVGGFDGIAASAGVQVFDPATGKWANRAPMPTARYLFAVEVLDGKLYVMGGWLNLNGSPWVDVYDPSTNTWSTAPYMLVGRASEGAAVINGRLYAVGGACDYQALDAVEAFTP